MSEQLEWNEDTAWRVLHRSAVCLGLCSYILLTSHPAQAVESEDVPRPAEPTTSEIAVAARKKPTAAQNIAGADLVDKLDATPDADDKAAVVDVGDGQDILPQSKGKWAV